MTRPSSSSVAPPRPFAPRSLRSTASFGLVFAGVLLRLAAGQTCGTEVALEFGTNQGAGYEWGCSAAGPIEDQFGKFRVRSTKGTWFTLQYQAYVANPTRQAEVDTFLATYPWLAPVTPWDVTELSPWSAAGQPLVIVDRDLTFLLTLMGITEWPDFVSFDENAVKSFYQPVFDDPPGPEQESTRLWQAEAEVWQQNPPRGAQSNPWIDLWKGMLERFADDEVYSVEAIAKGAILLQNPDVNPDLFFDGSGYGDAVDLGLFVTVQAIAVIDPNPMVTTSETTTGGLPSLPTALPYVNVSPPLCLRVIAAAPLGRGSGPGAIPPGTPTGVPLHINNHGKLFNVIGPMHATFQLVTGPANAAILLRPTIFHPMRFQITLPTNIINNSPIIATNPYGPSSIGTYQIGGGN